MASESISKLEMKKKPFLLADRMNLEEGDFQEIPSFLRSILVTDGTVTRILEAVLLEPIRIECLIQKEIPLESDLPELEIRQGMTILNRQVLLHRRSTGEVYTFAESFIRSDRLSSRLREDLIEGRVGMGDLLRDRRMETYREIISTWKEKAGPQAPLLKVNREEPLLCRTYRIFTQQRPAILITEKFPRCHYEQMNFNMGTRGKRRLDHRG